MKIRLSELRKIIRETINEQGWQPGRWYPASGEPVDPDDVSLMGTGGLGDEEENLKEAALSAKGLKKSSYEEIQKKFPKFIELVSRKFGDDAKKASFAISSQVLLGLGGKIPLMATDNYEDSVVYWEDNVLKYNGSYTLADAVKDAK